jgi:hypothetical protein
MAYDLDWVTLMYRAQRACLDIAAVHKEVESTRTETQRVLALARQVSPADGWGIRHDTEPVVELPANTRAEDSIVRSTGELVANDDPHVLTMDALRVMRDILTDFPLEWQVNIGKALTARTMLVVAAQTHKQHLTPAA